MKLVQKIVAIAVIVLLLPLVVSATVTTTGTTIDVAVKNDALLLGAPISLSVTDKVSGKIVFLEDKLIEADGEAEFSPFDLKKYKGLKLYNVIITTYGYEEKKTVVILQRDSDGTVSKIIADTKAMSPQYLSEALSELYAFFNLTEHYKLVPETDFLSLSESICQTTASSEETYKTALTESVILLTVQHQLGSQIQSCFEGVLGVTQKLTNYNRLTDYQKETLFRNFSGKDYQTVADLLSAMNLEITSMLSVPPVTVPSVPSGGGGGGGSFSPPVTVTPDVTELQQKTTTQMNIAYTDMEGAKWASEAVESLSSMKILNGYADSTFRPGSPVTRAEFLKMLVALTKLSDTATHSFSDVAETDWFYPYVQTAYAVGFARGDGKSFYPNQEITRQDMCVMCHNVLKYYEVVSGEGNASFTDKTEISEYAWEAVDALSALKLINGMPDGSFLPKNTATRAEAATIIYKLWNVLEGM